MYECQFKPELELNADIEDFEWIVPRTGQQVEIPINTADQCFTLFNYSLETDFTNNNCDSIIQLTVEVLPLVDELTPGPCTSAGTEYTWELLLEDIPDVWPEIDPGYIVEWVRCDDVDFVFQAGTPGDPNPPFNVTAATSGEFCVRVEYTFTNDEFPVGSPEFVATCEEIFGPYDLQSDLASPPIIDGEREFCANELDNIVFTVSGATNTDMFTWNVAGTGAVIVNSSANGDMITLDLTNFDFSQPMLVDAVTACGNAQTPLNLSTRPVPVPEINITPEVCIGGTVTANEIAFGAGNPLITQYIWTPSNNDAATVDFPAATVGVQEVFLTVVDANGCMSDPVMASYEVFAPLETPVVTCGAISDSSVEFTWGIVDGATGYDVFVVTPNNPGGFNVSYDNTVQTHSETGLLIGQTVTITVTALGPPPCGDSAPSAPQDCTTQDCPAQLTVFVSGAGDVCENVTGQTFAFDIDATIVDVDGVFTTTLTPDGTYYDQTTGIVNPDGLAVGTYVISSDYNFNGNQCPRPGPIFTLTENPAPIVDFTLSATEICLGESVTIDESNVTPLITSFDPGIDGDRDGNNNLTWSSSGDKIIRVGVTTADGCIDSSEQVVTVLDTLILGPVTCTSMGLDFVVFDWDDVANAENYTVTYVVGTDSFDADINESMIMIDGLGTSVSVDITVTANPEAGFCDVAPQMATCMTNDCPPIDLSFNAGPFCFGQGSNPIDLELLIFDAAGTDITDIGNVEWLDPRVDVDGFDPGVSPDNESYPLSFLYTDQNGCESTRDIIVEVLAQPEPEIATIDGFCVDGNGVVMLDGTFGNGEDIVWEWDGGGATGAGPHDIAFASDGQFTITVTVTNGADGDGNLCEATTTQTVIVDPLLIAPVFVNCQSNNTGVTFEWAPVANAIEYEIVVDGTPVGTQDSLTFMIPAVPGESFDIEVTAISANNCPNVSSTDDCTATNCPPSTFADIDNVNMCLDGTEMQVQFDAIIMNAPPGNPIVPGSWSGTGVSADGLFDPSGLSPEGNILLSYSVEYAQDCVYSTSAFVTLFEAPQVVDIVPTNPDCFMDNVGEIELVAQGGTPPYTYQLENLPEQGDGVFSPLNPGVFNVTVSDDNGCTSDLQFEIVPAVEPDLAIGGPGQLVIGGENGLYTIENFPQSSDFEIGDVIWTATPLDGGDVIIICEGPDCEVDINLDDFPTLANGFDLAVTVIFNDDCFKDATIRVDVIEVPIPPTYYIPNVFSTNSTEVANQSWSMFVSGDEIVVNSVRVYDRWGELVHIKETDLEADDMKRVDLGWAGEWADQDDPNTIGEEVEQGVYVYLINLSETQPGGRVREIIESGDVSVLR